MTAGFAGKPRIRIERGHVMATLDERIEAGAFRRLLEHLDSREDV
jgi:hypothetical protein